MRVRFVSSRDNPVFREIGSVIRSGEGKTGQVFLEGFRLVGDAVRSGIEPLRALVARRVFERMEAGSQDLPAGFPGDASGGLLVFEDALFDSLCGTETPQGIAMLARSPAGKRLADLDPVSVSSAGIRCLVLESIQDPGNLGTLIRLADAFGFNPVILLTGCADPYSQKVLRSAMGSVFHLTLFRSQSWPDVLEWLSVHRLPLVAGDLAGIPLPEASLPASGALVIGNEGRGLSEEARKASDLRVAIPMPGHAESLNAAMAAAILAYTMSAASKDPPHFGNGAPRAEKETKP